MSRSEGFARRFVSLVCILVITFSGLRPAYAKSPQADVLATDNQDAWQPYIHYLQEFSERRRVNVYFKNEQSIFYGVQVKMVNVGRGNLTFLRRDLVTVGRIPLMVARVYDSSVSELSDFGIGWRLSAAETISVNNGKALLTTESGVQIEFVQSANGFELARDFPSDYTGILRTAEGKLVCLLRTGLTKEFSPIADLFRLTRVSDRNGNEVRLRYSTQGLLSRIEGGKRFIELKRNQNGLVNSVKDDQNRTVTYVYSPKQMLVSVTDLGGNSWTQEYNGQGRLHRALDPLGRENFRIWYTGDGRVRRLEMPSGRIRFDYDDAARSTRVTDRKNLVSQYFHNEEASPRGL